MKIGWMVIALPLVVFASSFLTAPGNDTVSGAFQPEYIADQFDYPVGKPDAEGYYNAQGFGDNNHLGDDWNAKTGGNSDLGHPFYTVANGYVTFAEDIRGGWGNVIRVLHQLPDGTQVESLYAHADTVLVKKGDWVKRGQQIGTIGTAHGLYWAHLHFEMRTDPKMAIGGGYSTATGGYLDPTAFIEAHRVD
jgi:murein DD-endopeptidase MepM/ murein hydrolase activator NlpD